MDDYLEKFGFSPEDFGVKPTPKATVASARKPSMKEPENENQSFSDMKLRDLPLAMAYVPMQYSLDSYDVAMALNNGTLFPALNKPLTGKRN